MKKLSWQCGLLAVAAFTLITGCRKKKEPTVTPQAQAPTITAPMPPPRSQSTPKATTTGSAPAPASSSPAPQTSAPVKKTKKKKRKPRTQVAKKTGAAETQPPVQAAAATPPTATPSAAVTTAPASIRTSAASAHPAADTGTVGISAAMDHSEEARQRELTQQLLSSTDANLKGITRPLTADERAMVDEIRNYMAQSRAAITDGDFIRANNLATKAHLLSDELVKH